MTNLEPNTAIGNQSSTSMCGFGKKYGEATSLQDKVYALEEYMAAVPKHKGTEKLLQQLKTRHVKLIHQLEGEQTRRGAGSGHGRCSIKREGAAQLVILGRLELGRVLS